MRRTLLLFTLLPFTGFLPVCVTLRGVEKAPPPAVNSQRTIITHAVLIGLTPLIPVPVVDDLAKSYFQRRMVRSLAAMRGRGLSAEDVDTLATERGGGGCLRGCLSTVVVYPLKKIFRKIFFFLEWKRAVDLTSASFHHGYLVDYALAEWDALGANTKTTAEVRDAIDAVCREAPIKPLESAVGATFRQSKNVLVGGARLLEGSFRRITGRADAQQVARAVESVEAEEEREIEGVVDHLQRSVDGIPQGHFDNLRARLAARLRQTPPPPTNPS